MMARRTKPAAKRVPLCNMATMTRGAVGDSTAKEGASTAASLEGADFTSLTSPEQTRAIEAVIRHFARRLQRLKTRREHADARGRRLDLRRTLRCSIGAGGAPARLHFVAPRRIRPRLILLLDVSRSMSL